MRRGRTNLKVVLLRLIAVTVGSCNCHHLDSSELMVVDAALGDRGRLDSGALTLDLASERPQSREDSQQYKQDVLPLDAGTASFQFDSPARYVSASCGMACAVLASGSVYCWGNAATIYNGGMGEGRLLPRRIEGLDAIENFASSCFVGCGADRNHDVWCFGSNYADLRTGTSEEYLVRARRRLDISGIEQVAVRGYSFMGRGTDGSIFIWIGTPSYRLLRVSFRSPVVDLRATHDGYCAVLQSGEVACSDPNDLTATPQIVDGLTGVIAAAIGFEHACVLKRDGTVWCWGLNDLGQTGTPPESSEMCAGQTFTDERGNLVRPFHACIRRPRQVLDLADVVEVGVAQNRSCARRRDGTVWCWGGNTFGWLGDGLPPSEVCPSVAWDPPRLTPDPNPCRRHPSRVSVLSGVISLAVADGFVCAVRSNGQVWCWGNNSQGSLGTGDQVSSPVPVLVPASSLRRDQ